MNFMRKISVMGLIGGISALLRTVRTLLLRLNLAIRKNQTFLVHFLEKQCSTADTLSSVIFHFVICHLLSFSILKNYE